MENNQTEPEPNTNYNQGAKRMFFLKNLEKPKSEKKPRTRKLRKDSKEPILASCLLCKFHFRVKYVFSKKRHSLKNN